MKLISILALTLSLTAFAEDRKSADPRKEEMMKKMQEYSTPTETHKTLASMAGKWTYSSKWWHSAESQPEESKGTSNMKMILGGRYLQQEVKGKAMGMPFEGLSLTGYDNLKERIDTLWIDSMSTGMMRGTGSVDATTKTITDSGEFTCPMEEDKTAEYRSEWKMTDKNNMTYSMFGKGMGNAAKEEFKMMEMSYKRSK